MILPFDLTLGQGGYLAAALCAAAFIRGFSGFGFSAIFIMLAALVTNPVPLLPVIFSCEILMTAFQARGIRPHVDWGRVIPLWVGAAIATVPAIYVMARLDETEARLTVSILILALSLILLSGWTLKRPIGRGGHGGVGAFSGMVNSAGVGGLPVAAFMTAQSMSPAIFRATMIVYLTGLDIMALPVMAVNGLVTLDTFWAISMAFPILGLGVWLGSTQFSTISQTAFRRFIILMLTGFSLANIIRVIA